MSLPTVRRTPALLIAACCLGGAVAAGQAPDSVTPDADIRVERGRYVAAAGDCISCHTRPGAPAFAGGVPFETPFGTIYSSNITPDPETGIGRWSEADLKRALHEGLAPGGRPLYPAFPYPEFTKISDADASDLFAYLRSLPAVRSVPPASGSLFSMRWSVAVWNLMFFRPGRFAPDATQSAEWNRGAYLVEGLAHCGACHTPRNWLLAERPGAAYGGAVIRGELRDGRQGDWYAVTLTGRKQGLAGWSTGELAKYLATGFSPRAGTFGPMNEVIVNSLGRLAAADVQAIATYLKSLPGRSGDGPGVTPEAAGAGAALYRERCEKCHGASGRGNFFGGPPLAASAVVQGEDPASLINITLHGPATPPGLSFGGWETMQAYRDVLDDSQVAAILNFVRGSFGNRAPPVTAEQVRRQR